MRGDPQSSVDSTTATTNILTLSSNNQGLYQMQFAPTTVPSCNFTAPPVAPTVSEGTQTSSVTPQGLSELFSRNVELLARVGWQDFVKIRRWKGNFASLDNVTHPARRLLMHYKHRGAPVKFSTAPWTRGSINQAIKRGLYRSCNGYIDFLEEKFVDMIQKGQWVILPASVAKQLPIEFHLLVLCLKEDNAHGGSVTTHGPWLTRDSTPCRYGITIWSARP
jgi:hypothetical protein